MLQKKILCYTPLHLLPLWTSSRLWFVADLIGESSVTSLWFAFIFGNCVIISVAVLFFHWTCTILARPHDFVVLLFLYVIYFIDLCVRCLIWFFSPSIGNITSLIMENQPKFRTLYVMVLCSARRSMGELGN